MAGTDYDIVTVGGGLGGAALAKVMAERGARVLVLEREAKFKDRVRGEGMAPWGSAEAERLGLRDWLLAGCGHENRWWDIYLGPMLVAHRDTVETTPGGRATMTFYHPDMQETLLRAAADAGAEVRRGVKVSGVRPGPRASVTVSNRRGSETISARFVVGADGRNSLVRKWTGFEARDDPPRLRIAGVLFDNMTALPQDTTRLILKPEGGRGAIVFPQGGGRVRVYVVHGAQEALGLQGDDNVARFVAEADNVGLGRELFDGTEPAGPLATFDGADSFVEHPYRDGVALIGDAAATSDPTWGQGLSLTMRDVRALRDALIANGDWNAAGHAYAEQHDRVFSVAHCMEGWFTSLFYTTGPEADAMRGRAVPLQLGEPARQPDAFLSGPESVVADERTRRRFFGEE